MKKQFILGMAMVMGMSMFGAGSVLAADPVVATQAVPVSYDNSAMIVVPDAAWSVSVPAAVAFKSDTKTQDVSVALVPVKEGEVLADSLSVDVKALSTNDFKLVASGANTPNLSYEVKYGDAVLTSAAPDVATLTKTAPKKSGTASTTATPTKALNYKDTLTYTITGTTTP